jgi:hypothetical protein
MKKLVLWLVVILGVLIAAIWTWNFTSLQQPLSKVLESDPRNKGIEVRVHFRNFVDPDVLVFDIRKISGTNSAADVSRVLLQFGSALKAKRFESVVLAFRGTEKFMLKGPYFSQLGNEYGIQNPVYTLRTLPENVLRIDGSPAFPKWTGGMLGVTGKQMDDLNEFHKQWWISTAIKDS